MSNERAFEVFEGLDPRQKSHPEWDMAAELAKGLSDPPDEQNGLDELLIAAWEKMSARLRADRVEAWRRFRRTRTAAMTRPVREFCAVLRSNDTRMDDYWGLPMSRDAVEERRAHALWLKGDAIRELMRPVRIITPVEWWKAAHQLGMHREAFRYWMRHAPGIHVEYHRHRIKQFYGMVPYVRFDHPIDPMHFVGQSPHPMWSNLWQFLGKSIPETMEVYLKREPRWRRHKGKVEFRGWDFICPGRRNEKKRHIRCGRRCRRLFWPVSVNVIGGYLGDVDGFEVGAPEVEAQARVGDSGLRVAGRWHPESDPVRAAAAAAGAGGMGFACDHCWRPRYLRMSRPEKAWNEFVRTLSGGMLYGRDVKRPAWITEACGARRRPARKNAGARVVEAPVRVASEAG